MEEKQPDQVIIYCGMHGLYEMADHNGYTNDPRKAGIYDRAKVQDLVGSPYSERKNELLPVPHDHQTRIAERIASLAAERDALAAQNVDLRGALEQAIKSAHPHPVEHPTMTAAWAVMRAALSLPLPAAADKVAGWREKAEKASGLGDHCRQLRIALAEALQLVFAELPPQPHDGSCGGPDNQCDQACADAANAYATYRRLFKVKNDAPHHYEQIAAANAEKAELLEWLESIGGELYRTDSDDPSRKRWAVPGHHGAEGYESPLSALRAARGAHVS